MPIPKRTAAIVPIVESARKPIDLSNGSGNSGSFISLAHYHSLSSDAESGQASRFSRKIVLSDARCLAPAQKIESEKESSSLLSRMNDSPSPSLGVVQLPMVSSFRSGTRGSPEQSSRTTATPASRPSPDTSLIAGSSFSLATTPQRDSPDFSHINAQGIPVYKPRVQNHFLRMAARLTGRSEIYTESTGPGPLDLLLEKDGLEPKF